MNLTVKITTNCEMEMEPALDECYSHEGDSHYEALVAVADAIKNGRTVKGGTMISLDTAEAVRALRDEASFRSGSCFDQAQDAWDNSERMMFFAMKRSFDSIVKKCDAVLPTMKLAPISKPVERVVEPKPVETIERQPGAYVDETVVNGRTLFSGYYVTPSGQTIRCDKRATFEQALADAEFFVGVK